jgi:hypothetical protein
MIADSQPYLQILDINPKPAMAEVWHLWTVIIPRRSITGRLVHGQIWRRRDGRRWIYKKFVECAAVDRRPANTISSGTSTIVRGLTHCSRDAKQPPEG